MDHRQLVFQYLRVSGYYILSHVLFFKTSPHFMYALAYEKTRLSVCGEGLVSQVCHQSDTDVCFCVSPFGGASVYGAFCFSE